MESQLPERVGAKSKESGSSESMDGAKSNREAPRRVDDAEALRISSPGQIELDARGRRGRGRSGREEQRLVEPMRNARAPSENEKTNAPAV
jgi:hypothetical protein